MIRFMELIILAASFIGAVAAITAILKKFIASELEPLKNQIHKMDVKECRRFLIDFLIDVENDTSKDEIQWKFAHDVYDHYINERLEVENAY